jgi:hypothetical protein
MSRHRLFKAALVAAFGIVSAAHAQDKAGAVDSVFGIARAALPQTERSLAAGDNVFLGETVVTAAQSRMSLQLGAVTRIKLGENVRLRIDRYLVGTGGTLTLGQGAMLFDRPAGSPPEALRIRGDFGVIAVRGTRFFVGPSQGKLAVFVDHGKVTVTSGGATVALGAGEGTEIARRGAKPEPVRIWSVSRINDALGLVR